MIQKLCLVGLRMLNKRVICSVWSEFVIIDIENNLLFYFVFPVILTQHWFHSYSNRGYYFFSEKGGFVTEHVIEAKTNQNDGHSQARDDGTRLTFV